jgi:dolichol kinase
MHATICSAIIAFLPKIFPKKRIHLPLMLFTFLIILSRIYLGVHYLSDLLAGSVIGYVIAKVILSGEEKYQLTNWFLHHVKSKLELRRQIAHAFSAVSIALLIKFDLLHTISLFILIIIGIGCSLSVKYQKIPFILHLLRPFERKDHLTQFPGKGAIYLLIGSFMVTIFFPKPIALASIMIMGLGDAVSTLVGTYFGKLKNPLNPIKHLEGTVLAIIIATIGAFNFVPFQMAFLGATFAMAWEIFSIRFLDKTFDDNLIIPLIAALTMNTMA